MFVPSNPDWSEVQGYYDRGNSPAECRARFGLSAGEWAEAVAAGLLALRAKAGRARGSTRAAVRRLLAAGLTQAQIARELRVSKPTVCFHARALGVVPRPELARRYDWAEIRQYYEDGHSATECRRWFGFARGAWVAAIERGDITPRPRAEPTEAVLIKGRRRNRGTVKLRLLGDGLKAARCELCGIDAWLGQPLGLELHHLNGDGEDNRLENLQLLCPNCHSQTDTWGGRKLRAARSRPAG